MINKAADYVGVGGDINRVIINGGIMPLRADMFSLRGEDVAFLAEAAIERSCAFDAYRFPQGTDTSWVQKVNPSLTFNLSRSISASQLNSMRNLYVRAFDYTTFLSTLPPEYELYREDYNPNYKNGWFANHTLGGINPPSWQSGESLMADKISTMFDICNQMRFPAWSIPMDYVGAANSSVNANATMTKNVIRGDNPYTYGLGYYMGSSDDEYGAVWSALGTAPNDDSVIIMRGNCEVDFYADLSVGYIARINGRNSDVSARGVVKLGHGYFCNLSVFDEAFVRRVVDIFGGIVNPSTDNNNYQQCIIKIERVYAVARIERTTW